MHFEAIDHVVLPVGQLAGGVPPFEKLGLKGIIPPPYLGALRTGRCFFTGTSHSLFHLEMAEAAADHPLGKIIGRAVEERRGLCAAIIRVRGLTEIASELRSKGVVADVAPIFADVGEEIGTIARLVVDEECGVPLALCEYRTSSADQQAEIETEDGLNHAFPVRRLDHLASVSRNMASQTHFWAQVLGVPQFGEVVTPALVIRQFKIGDAIIELLAPNSPDSPIHKRPPGLISMISLEVPDLAVAVAQARAAGFAVPDPATGVLPGTITATIPAIEMSGLALQMLQYV